MSLQTEAFGLDEAQHKYISGLIIKSKLNSSTQSDNPQVVITGGQPASGKGELARNGMKYFDQMGGSILIDTDELRMKHPYYNAFMEADDKSAAAKTHDDASSWSKELLVASMDGKRNIVLDQLSSNPIKLKDKIDQFRVNGYGVIQLHVMAVSPLTSLQGIYHRYWKQKLDPDGDGTGRFVPRDIHDDACNGVPWSVGEVEKGQWVDNLVIFDQEYKVLLQLEKVSVELVVQLVAESTIRVEQQRLFSEEEKLKHDAEWQKLIENTKKNGGKDIQEMECIRLEHRKQLGLTSR